MPEAAEHLSKFQVPKIYDYVMLIWIGNNHFIFEGYYQAQFYDTNKYFIL